MLSIFTNDLTRKWSEMKFYAPALWICNNIFTTNFHEWSSSEVKWNEFLGTRSLDRQQHIHYKFWRSSAYIYFEVPRRLVKFTNTTTSTTSKHSHPQHIYRTTTPQLRHLFLRKGILKLHSHSAFRHSTTYSNIELFRCTQASTSHLRKWIIMLHPNTLIKHRRHHLTLWIMVHLLSLLKHLHPHPLHKHLHLHSLFKHLHLHSALKHHRYCMSWEETQF